MKHKGFTLIELLVVIAIIVILATLAMTSYRTATVRARDARRQADMEQIRSALEMYRSDPDLEEYPAYLCGNVSNDFNAMIGDLQHEDYWNTGTPEDPLGAGATQQYDYCSNAGTDYSLSYYSEVDEQLVTLNNP